MEEYKLHQQLKIWLRVQEGYKKLRDYEDSVESFYAVALWGGFIIGFLAFFFVSPVGLRE